MIDTDDTNDTDTDDTDTHDTDDTDTEETDTSADTDSEGDTDSDSGKEGGCSHISTADGLGALALWAALGLVRRRRD